MKRTRFTEEQIIGVLTGTQVVRVLDRLVQLRGRPRSSWTTAPSSPVTLWLAPSVRTERRASRPALRWRMTS